VAHDLVREVVLADLPELRGAALRRLGRLEESSGELRAAAMVPVFEEVVKRNPGEVEFHQAVREVLESLRPVVANHPGTRMRRSSGGCASRNGRSSSECRGLTTPGGFI
jgi:hypothetical protein